MNTKSPLLNAGASFEDMKPKAHKSIAEIKHSLNKKNADAAPVETTILGMNQYVAYSVGAVLLLLVGFGIYKAVK